MQTIKIKNKKAISNIVASVLMILLIVAAIATLSTSVLNLVKSPALSPENSCPVLLSKKPIQIQSACYNSVLEETEIIIKRNNDKTTINNLIFSLDNEAYTCSNSCGSCQIPTTIGTQKYFFSENAEEVTLNVNGCLIEKKEVGVC
ncbi:hypothetical protein CMI46_02600 [Candidatus Pacearchaeota archaeon]|nr:hypothetical protein [Candidatus Pacearchaeota archaeon]|tara:strand:- start:5143 stop:5580 length:438 start_codon:yes stop_codon:yes gene_type:complete